MKPKPNASCSRCGDDLATGAYHCPRCDEWFFTCMKCERVSPNDYGRRHVRDCPVVNKKWHGWRDLGWGSHFASYAGPDRWDNAWWSAIDWTWRVVPQIDVPPEVRVAVHGFAQEKAFGAAFELSGKYGYVLCPGCGENYTPERAVVVNRPVGVGLGMGPRVAANIGLVGCDYEIELCVFCVLDGPGRGIWASWLALQDMGTPVETSAEKEAPYAMDAIQEAFADTPEQVAARLRCKFCEKPGVRWCDPCGYQHCEDHSTACLNPKRGEIAPVEKPVDNL